MTVNAGTGQMSGYAWSESLGWVSFRGGTGAAAYGVAEYPEEQITAIPTLSGMGLMALIVALGAGGLWVMRRA